MKIRHIFGLLPMLLLGSQLQGQVADKITVIDTRSVNDPPTTFHQEARLHFKQSSVVGLPSSAYYSGVMTVAPWGDNSGNKHHQIGFNESGLFWRTGSPQSSSWDSWMRIVNTDANGNIGIGVIAPTSQLDVDGTGRFRMQGSTTAGITIGGGAMSLRGWGPYNPYIEWRTANETRQGYMGWNADRLSLVLENGYNFTIENGNVGIGTTTPGSFKLAVNGKVWAQEVQVAINNPGPDYVFEKDYKLLSLEQIKTYIDQHKHLPEVPSAKEMETNGVNVSEMNMLLLKKIEELTLHVIELKKELNDLKQNKK